MGWNAYTKGTELSASEKGVFEGASEWVRAKTGRVDGMLDMGGLDTQECAFFLEEITGERVFQEGKWSAEKVKELVENTKWEEPKTPENLWIYWSVRKYLETCTQLGLSVRFGL